MLTPLTLAADSEVALGLVEAFDYDLMVLDLILPGLDGLSLCQKFRRQGGANAHFAAYRPGSGG